MVQHSPDNKRCWLLLLFLCCLSLSPCAWSLLRLPLLLRRHPAVAAAPRVLCLMPHRSRKTSMLTHPHS